MPLMTAQALHTKLNLFCFISNWTTATLLRLSVHSLCFQKLEPKQADRHTDRQTRPNTGSWIWLGAQWDWWVTVTMLPKSNHNLAPTDHLPYVAWSTFWSPLVFKWQALIVISQIAAILSEVNKMSHLLTHLCLVTQLSRRPVFSRTSPSQHSVSVPSLRSSDSSDAETDRKDRRSE